MSFARHQAVGAYRRWEPPDFDDEGRVREAPAEPSPAPAPPPSPAPEPEPELNLPPDFQLPTAEEIERMHEEVRAAGFEEGRKQGHAEGLEMGLREGYADGKARAEAEAQRLAALADQLDAALTGLDHEVAEELMALAIELARRVVGHIATRHPEHIIDTVRTALAQVPQAHAHIRLHPDDLALVREHLGEQLAHAGHRLQEDMNLARGDCRLDAQGAQVDATLQTRWRRVLESIGHDGATLAVDDAPRYPASPPPGDGHGTSP